VAKGVKFAHLILKYRNIDDGSVHFRRFEEHYDAIDYCYKISNGGLFEPLFLTRLDRINEMDAEDIAEEVANHEHVEIHMPQPITQFSAGDVPAIAELMSYLGGDAITPQEWSDFPMWLKRKWHKWADETDYAANDRSYEPDYT